MCRDHKNEVIQFFCPNHEALGCHECMAVNHRTCKIDYIPDKCSGIGDSAEFKEVLRELDQKVNETEYVIKLASCREEEIDSCHDRLLKEITMFRKEINDRLDQLQKQIQTEAEKKKVTDKHTVKKVLEQCTNTSTDIKQLQSRLQDYKASQQNGQLYITMKHAKSKLKSDELNEADRSLEKTNMQYTFETNQDLESMLSRQDALGKLALSSSIKDRKTIQTLTHKENINIETKSDLDLKEVRITGCVVLSANKLVAADNNKAKLKVVNITNKDVVEELKLSSEPWDIALMHKDHIAVTMPENEEILIISTAGNLSIVRKFPVEGRCRGIAYHQDHLYIVCNNYWRPNGVIITDTHGNVKNTIVLDKQRFDTPNYILLSVDLRHIFISDLQSNSVVSLTLGGDISAENKNKDFGAPMGMMMLHNGSLLVCCGRGHGIIHSSNDLKQCHTMIDAKLYPRSICYNRYTHNVYVGGIGNQLGVFIAKFCVS